MSKTLYVCTKKECGYTQEIPTSICQKCSSPISVELVSDDTEGDRERFIRTGEH